MAAKVVTTAQQKGGAGKTTLAVQLAVAWHAAGKRVAIVDVDPQRTAADWYSLRLETLGEGAAPAVQAVSGWRLDGELSRLKDKADVVVVDSPPHAETDARVAIRKGDIVLIPVQPTPPDVWATQPTLAIARDEKTPALLVLNRVPPRAKLADRMIAQLQDLGAEAAETRLGNRTAFAETLLDGRGVAETAANGAAGREIATLAAEIAGRIGL